ncbi:hypothetical protein D3C87_1036140 [compost metagenome]
MTKHIPIDGTDLFAEVDDDTFDGLEHLGAEKGSGPGYPYHLTIRNGDVWLHCPRFRLEIPLKKWIIKPSRNECVLFDNRNRRDLRRDNLAKRPRSEVRAFHEQHSIPAAKPSSDPRFVWISELQAFVSAWYGRRNERKPGEKQQPPVNWKRAKRLHCFSSAEAAATYLANSKAERLAEHLAARKRDRDRRDHRVKAAVDAVPKLAEDFPFIPLDSRLSLKGKAWGLGKKRSRQSAFLVMFGLQYRCTIAREETFLADYADLSPKLGLNPDAIADRLDDLVAGRAISAERRKSGSLERGTKGKFNRNLSRRCSFHEAANPAEPVGRFPTALFGEPAFQALDFREKGVLVALYLQAQGKQSVDFLIGDIMAHAGYENSVPVRDALKNLELAGFFVRYHNPCVDRHHPYETTWLHVTFKHHV